MEKEMLLATNDDFYYDGVPSEFSYDSSSILESGYSESCLETTGAKPSYNTIYNASIQLMQLLLIILAGICIIKGIYNIIKNKKIKQESLMKEKEGNVIIENPKKVKKKAVIIYFIFSFLLGVAYMVLETIKTFAAKPIIYIYPEEETEVKIKVKNPEKLTCTYPKYKDGWNVLAKPNGDLVDLETKRNLYALYWEGINTVKPNLKEGFIVEGEKVAEFLEEKLEILGLNEREAEEFIVYWLPLMEKNKYNYIRFETLDEINENMKLEIDPKPETLIRINMEFKGIRKPFDVKEQKLERVERKGYTVVEWGGTKL